MAAAPREQPLAPVEPLCSRSPRSLRRRITMRPVDGRARVMEPATTHVRKPTPPAPGRRRRRKGGWERAHTLQAGSGDACTKLSGGGGASLQRSWPSNGEDNSWRVSAASCSCVLTFASDQNSMPALPPPWIMKPMCSMKWEQAWRFVKTMIVVHIVLRK